MGGWWRGRYRFSDTASQGVPVYFFEEKGFDSKHREALCFAVFGYLGYLELPNVEYQTTTAPRDAIAGNISLPSIQAR